MFIIIMKILLTFFVLFYSFSLLSDDISEFEIEGMSIGDSALDFFTRKDLENNKQFDWFDTTLYTPIAELYLSNSLTYESFQISVKTDDKNYEIVNISGFVFYDKNNIKECYEKLDNISKEIKKLFVDVTDSGKSTYNHPYDKSGKSKITDIELHLNDKGRVIIQCYDWSDQYPYTDSLRINIMNEEYAKFLVNAYN